LSTHKNLRRRYYLPGTSQPRMLFGVLFILVYVSLILTVSLYISTHPNLPDNYQATRSMLITMQFLMVPMLVLINLVGVVISAVLLLLYTHRIAGPVYNLGRVLRAITKGDLNQEIRFRKNDYLKELAQDGNAAIEYLRQEIGSAQQLVEDLENCLEPGKISFSQTEITARMSKIVQQLSEQMGKFQVK
jgi:methyl-accepting chemotaxis protein